MTKEEARAELARRGIDWKTGKKAPSTGLQKAEGWAQMPEKTLGATLDVMQGQAKNPVAKAGLGILGKTMPSTVSPLGIGLMAGAEAVEPAAKAIAPMARGLGRQLESLSGMKPGLLGKAYRDPSLIFRGIPQQAREAYQATKPFLRQSKMITETANPMALVQKALKAYEAGTLQPEEALESRKVIDQLWDTKRVTKAWADAAREKLDSVVKLRGSLQRADVGFSRGSQGAGLRQLFPQNKYGGTSAFKTAIMAGLNQFGEPGKLAMSAMSPLVQGAGASGLGAATQIAQNPGLMALIASLIKNLPQDQP